MNSMSYLEMEKLIHENLPGPTEEGILSSEIEARTGIPSRKAAAFIKVYMHLKNVAINKERRHGGPTRQNFYRRKF